MIAMDLRLSVLFLVVLSTILSCQKKKNAAPQGGNRQQGPLTVEGFVVEERAISDQVEVPGSLMPAEETQLKTEVSGRVVLLNIDEGSDVKKGTLLLKLFDQDLQAQLKKLQVQLQIAAKTEERQRELLQINGISQQDYDLSTLSVENLKADILAVQIAISKTEIRAPYAGKLGLRNVSLGAYLSPNEVVTTLRQVETLKLEFSVPEKYAKEIREGALINFRVDGGNNTHGARVIATESGVDQATRTLRVRARVDEKDAELVPGIFAKVRLQLGKSANALMIPTQAVVPQARTKEVIVFRKDSAQFIPVETGIRDSVFVQIVQGLKVGDTVVTTGLMAIRPNAKIKIGKVTRYNQ
jgi:membrane fusion protein (multidrug efflux system)